MYVIKTIINLVLPKFVSQSELLLLFILSSFELLMHTSSMFILHGRKFFLLNIVLYLNTILFNIFNNRLTYFCCHIL